MKKVKHKKFQNDVPEIPFLYDFYLVYWEISKVILLGKKWMIFKT